MRLLQRLIQRCIAGMQGERMANFSHHQRRQQKFLHIVWNIVFIQPAYFFDKTL